MNPRFLALSAILACSLLFGACGYTYIEPGHVGIQVNASGNQRGVADYPVLTGRQWYNPVQTSIIEYPTFVQNVVWTHNTNEGNPVNEEITFTNADKFPIAVDVNLSYHIEGAKAPAFYVMFRNDDLLSFSNGFLHNKARDVFNNVAGRYRIDDIMGNNTKFLTEVHDELQMQLNPLGVILDQFGIIGAPRPPGPVSAAISASAEATQKAIQIQNELAQTEAEAKKTVAQAEGAANARLAQANAEATANKTISASISPTLVEYMRVQKWDGSLPQVTGGGAIPMLNLNTGK